MLTVLLALLLSLGAALGATRIQAEVDFVDTVPADPDVQAYRDMLQQLDGLRFVAIYMAHDPESGLPHLRTDTGFDALVREQQNLTLMLNQRFPGTFSHSLSVYEAMRAGNYMLHKIATAGNPPPDSYALPRDPTTWQAVRQQVRQQSNVDEVLAADGSSSLALFFFATKDHYEARRLAGEVEQAVDAWSQQEPRQHPATHQHATTGLLSSSHYVDQRNQTELRTWTLASSLGVTLLLFIAFRRASDVLIAILSLLIAVLWTFGIMGWIGIRISFLTVFLAPLIMGVGIDYAIHLLERHRQERSQGRTRGQAMRHALRTTGAAIRLTALTTAAALALLLLVPAPLFAQIGGVAALGVALSVVVALTLTPALRLLWPEPAPRVNATDRRSLLEQVGLFAHRRRRPIRAVFAITTLGMVLVALPFTHVESGSAENEFPASDPVLQLRQRVEREYGSFQNAYLIIQGDATQPHVLRALHDASIAARTLNLYYSSTSIAALLIADAATDQGAIDVLQTQAQQPQSADRLPTTPEEARKALDALFADPLWKNLAPFAITRDYRLAIIAIRLQPTEDADALLALRQDLRALRDTIQTHIGNGYTVSAAGAPVHRANVIEQTPRDVALAIIGSSLVTATLLGIAWGRRHGTQGLRLAGLASLIVLAAATWLLALIPLLDASYRFLHQAGLAPQNTAALNNMFLLAFALTIGIGVDNAVHLISRYWQAAHQQGAGLDALRHSLRHGGRAITITTATTFLAFSLLAGTYFLQSKNLAILAALGALLTYLFCMLLIPGFLVDKT